MKILCIKNKVKLLLLLFSLTLGPMLILLLGSMHRGMSRFDQAIQISENVVEQSRSLYRLTHDIESHWQRYIITGRQEELTPYHLSNQVFDRTLNQLRDIMSRSPQALRNLEKIEHLRYKWLGVVADPTIQARQQLQSTQYNKKIIDLALRQESQERFNERIQQMVHQFPTDLDPIDRIAIVELTREATASFAAIKGALLTTEQHHINAFYLTYADVINRAGPLMERLTQHPQAQQQLQEFMDLYRHWYEEIALPQIKAQIASNQSPMTLEDAIAIAVQRFDTGILKELKSEINYFTRFLMDDMHDQLTQSRMETDRMTTLCTVLGLVGYLLILIFLVLLKRSILRPIAILNDGIQHIQQGDLSHQIELNSGDEFASLAQSFNSMTEQLQDKTEHLIEVNQTLTFTNRELSTHQHELEQANRQLAKEITERQEAQEELALTVKELQDANRYLEDFAFIASHDLKTPVRGLGSLASMLAYDYGHLLDTEGRNSLNLLVQRAQRTYNQIDGILEFSRLFKAEKHQEAVSVSQLLNDIVEELSPPANIEIHYPEDLPTLLADTNQLRVLFFHLLTNAILFLDKPQGEIRINVQDDESSWLFSVTDNGPGIAEKYHEKIFGFFQTLARKDDRETTGIGLPLARKIVESYQGKIWVESQLGQGATFYIRFPKAKMACESNTPVTSTPEAK